MRPSAMRFSFSRAIPCLLPMVALVMLGSVGCHRPKDPVAQVGGTWIGQPEWAAYLKENPGGDLPGLIRHELAFQLTEKKGFLKGTELQDYVQVTRRTALAQAYLAAQPGHGNFTEAQAKEAFMASGETRHVSHILCATQAEAQAALQRVTKGEAFAAVAATVSKDPSAKQNQGDLGWIKREQMVAPFASAVFAAKPGSLCGPFQSEFGWHVASVHEVRTPDPAEFEKSKASLMAAMQQSLAAQRRPEALQPLKVEFPLTPDKAVLDLDRTTAVAPGDENRTAGRLKDKTISLRELKLFISENMKMSGASHGLGPETKGQFMEILADDYRLAAAAEKQGLEKRPEVQAAIWMRQRKVAYGAFAKNYLSSYKVSDADLNGHYTANKDRFRGIGAVKLYLLVADQAETIENASKEAQKGTPWNVLFAKYANRISTGQWDAGWLEIASLLKILPKDAVRAMLQSPEGTLIGPVPGPDGFILFKVLGHKPGDVLPLQECQAAVQADFLKERGAALVDKYLDTEGRNGIKVKEYPGNAGALKGH